MTPEERIAALEARAAVVDERMMRMERKLDQLIAAANMGKGAWWIILRIGGLLVGIAAIIGVTIQVRGGVH